MNQKGIATITIILIIVAILVLGSGFYFALNKNHSQPNISTPTPSSSPALTPPPKSPVPVPQETSLPPTLCSQIYDPVCGKNQKTYSNACTAKAAGVEVQSKGECKNTPLTLPPAPKMSIILLSPNDGTYTIGDPVGIQWSVSSDTIPKTYSLQIALSTGLTPGELITLSPIPTTKNVTLRIPLKITQGDTQVPLQPGAYRLKLTIYDRPCSSSTCLTSARLVATDSSDSTITIASAAQPPGQNIFRIEADNDGFYPSDVLHVQIGAVVKITFVARTQNISSTGLTLRSSKFETGPVKPGKSTTIEFVADQSFTISSYDGVSGIKQADLKVEVQ